MPTFAAQLGMQAASQAASGLIGTGMGLLLEGHNDRRQLRQQEKLQNLEIKGSKELTDYNAAKQLEMWKATNYPAQVEQMKLAGLNPALAYGMGGGGGVTANVATGKTSGGQAPSGGGEILAAQAMGLQLKMQEAQIKNLEADTNLKNADASNRPLQGKNIEASTSSILQGIENAKAQEKLLEATAKLKELSFYKESQTMNDVINGIRNQVEIQAETLESLKMQNEITQATLQDKIQQIKSEAIQIFLINKLTEVNTDKARADINLTNQKIWEISQTIAQKWKALDQAAIDLYLKKLQTDFNVSHTDMSKVIGGGLEKLINKLDFTFGGMTPIKDAMKAIEANANK